MATISIHRALTLISKSNETLSSAISRGMFVSTVQGVLRRPTDASFKTELELVTRIQSDTDKVESLLNLIAKLKAAVAGTAAVVAVGLAVAAISLKNWSSSVCSPWYSCPTNTR